MHVELSLSGDQEMKKNGNIKTYTAEQISRMEDRSDWARAEAMTHEQIEAAIASDPDETDMEIDWSKATLHLPEPKATLNMRIDKDVLDFFKSTGRGYQTRINAVLRAFKEAHTTPKNN